MGPDFAPALFRIIAILIAADAIGLAAFTIVPRLNQGRRFVAAVFAAAVLAAPYFGPPDSKKMCAGLALILIHTALRIVDCARFPPASARINFLNLLPFPFFLGVREEWNHAILNRPVLRQDEIRRMIAGWIGFGMAWLILLTIGQAGFLARNPWLDHLLKLPLFVFAVETVAAGTWSLERILGFDPMPLMNHFYRARTPAEFWNRYNLRVHTWLTRNAFVPAGGQRHPVRGIWSVFIASAIIHEIAFDVVTGVVDGTQAAFFLLQAPAVLLSRPLERFARKNGRVGDAAARMITWLWFAATSLLFFQQVSRVFPFYYASGQPPL